MRVVLTSAWVPQREGVEKSLIAQYFHISVSPGAAWKGFIAGDLFKNKKYWWSYFTDEQTAWEKKKKTPFVEK